MDRLPDPVISTAIYASLAASVSVFIGILAALLASNIRAMYAASPLNFIIDEGFNRAVKVL